MWHKPKWCPIKIKPCPYRLQGTWQLCSDPWCSHSINLKKLVAHYYSILFSLYCRRQLLTTINVTFIFLREEKQKCTRSPWYIAKLCCENKLWLMLLSFLQEIAVFHIEIVGYPESWCFLVLIGSKKKISFFARKALTEMISLKFIVYLQLLDYREDIFQHLNELNTPIQKSRINLTIWKKWFIFI